MNIPELKKDAKQLAIVELREALVKNNNIVGLEKLNKYEAEHYVANKQAIQA